MNWWNKPNKEVSTSKGSNIRSEVLAGECHWHCGLQVREFRWHIVDSVKAAISSLQLSQSIQNLSSPPRRYPCESLESKIRLLADCAFMLRDYTLAHSYYKMVKVRGLVRASQT